MERIKYSKIKSLIHFIKFKKPAPSGFILYFGKRGSGKSANIAKRFYIWKKKQKRIYDSFYSNIKINTDDTDTYYL